MCLPAEKPFYKRWSDVDTMQKDTRITIPRISKPNADLCVDRCLISLLWMHGKNPSLVVLKIFSIDLCQQTLLGMSDKANLPSICICDLIFVEQHCQASLCCAALHCAVVLRCAARHATARYGAALCRAALCCASKQRPRRFATILETKTSAKTTLHTLCVMLRPLWPL